MLTLIDVWSGLFGLFMHSGGIATPERTRDTRLAGYSCTPRRAPGPPHPPAADRSEAARADPPSDHVVDQVLGDERQREAVAQPDREEHPLHRAGRVVEHLAVLGRGVAC